MRQGEVIAQRRYVSGSTSWRDGRVEFQTVTSAEGLYRFENIPEGKYALKWQLPGEEGWIRRLHKEADVTVEPGRTHVIKSVNMSKGLVPR